MVGLAVAGLAVVGLAVVGLAVVGLAGVRWVVVGLNIPPMDVISSVTNFPLGLILFSFLGHHVRSFPAIAANSNPCLFLQ